VEIGSILIAIQNGARFGYLHFCGFSFPDISTHIVNQDISLDIALQ